MSKALKFVPQLRELRIHLSQTCTSSEGIRQFIADHYINLKKSNPTCPILIRECLGVQPRLWARYDGGRENSVMLSNLGSDEVLRQVQLLAAKD